MNHIILELIFTSFISFDPHGDFVSLAVLEYLRPLAHLRVGKSSTEKTTNLLNITWTWKCKCHGLNHVSFNLVLISVYQWFSNQLVFVICWSELFFG